jgi:DNA-damage-inducible protein D
VRSITINHYKTLFDEIAQYIENEQKEPLEIWFARKLQTLLGYARWEKLPYGDKSYNRIT